MFFATYLFTVVVLVAIWIILEIAVEKILDQSMEYYTTNFDEQKLELLQKVLIFWDLVKPTFLILLGHLELNVAKLVIFIYTLGIYPKHDTYASINAYHEATPSSVIGLVLLSWEVGRRLVLMKEPIARTEALLRRVRGIFVILLILLSGVNEMYQVVLVVMSLEIPVVFNTLWNTLSLSDYTGIRLDTVKVILDFYGTVLIYQAIRLLSSYISGRLTLLLISIVLLDIAVMLNKIYVWLLPNQTGTTGQWG